VRSSFETGRPEVMLEVDRGRAADLGVSATALGRTLRTAVDTAVTADPAMDVAAEIRALLEERLLAAW